MENLKERMRGHWMIFSIILALLLFSPITWQAFAGNNGNGPTGTENVPGANKWQVQTKDRLKIKDDGYFHHVFKPIEMRTSATGDLVIEVHAVCAIGVFDYTQLEVFAAGIYENEDVDLDAAFAKLEVKVKVDDEVLEPGWVDFCDRSVFQLRALELELVGIYTEVETTELSFDMFSTAAGFKWYAINVGNGVHEIEVKARVRSFGPGLEGFVFGALGDRNLTVLTTTTLQETTNEYR